MTTREMLEALQMEMGRMGEFPLGHTKDHLYWLNKSQEEFVKGAYTGNNKYGQAFEQSQKIIDRVRTVLSKNEELDTIYVDETSAIGDFEVDRAEFPDDYMNLISQRSVVEYNRKGIEYEVEDEKRVVSGDAKTMVSINRFSQADDIYALLNDPFNTTRPNSPLTDIHKDYIDIYTDSTFIVDKAVINYLRVPKEITLEDDCELPDITHKEIVHTAMILMLQGISTLRPEEPQSTNNE